MRSCRLPDLVERVLSRARCVVCTPSSPSPSRSASRASAGARRRTRPASPRRNRRSSAPSSSPGSRRVLAYDDLGAYKYLLRVAVDGGIRDATVDAVGKLADYDEQRGAQLLATLEEFLRRHGSISATSEALYVHPNTLRQRLRRIGELSGLDLRRDDWLASRSP